MAKKENRTPLSDMVADRLGVDRELMITFQAFQTVEMVLCIVCGTKTPAPATSCAACRSYLHSEPHKEIVPIKIPRLDEEEIDRRLEVLRKQAESGDEKAAEWYEMLESFHRQRRNRERWDSPSAQSLLWGKDS